MNDTGANSCASTGGTAGRYDRPTGVVSHHDREVAELRADRELAVEYLKAAITELENAEDRGVCLLALSTVVEAYGGLGVG